MLRSKTSLLNLNQFSTAYYSAEKNENLNEHLISTTKSQLQVLFSKNDFANAIELIDNLLSSRYFMSENQLKLLDIDRLILLKALALRNMNSFKDAIESMELVDYKKLQLSEKQLFFNVQGSMLNALGKYKAAIRCFEQSNRNDWVIHFNEGCSHFHLNNFSQCIKSLEIVLEHNPILNEALKLKSLCFATLKNFKQSIECLYEYSCNQPDDLFSFYLKSYCFFCLGDIIRSENYLHKCLKLMPGFQAALDLNLLISKLKLSNEYGIQCCLKRNFISAINFFDQSLKFNKNSREALYGKANALNLINQPEESRVCLTRYLEIYPDCAIGTYLFVRAIKVLGKPNEILKYCRKTVDIISQEYMRAHEIIKIDEIFDNNQEKILEEIGKYILFF